MSEADNPATDASDIAETAMPDKPVVPSLKRNYSWLYLGYDSGNGQYCVHIYNGNDGSFLIGPKNPIKEMALNGLFLSMLKKKDYVREILAVYPIMALASPNLHTPFPMTPNALKTIQAIVNFNGEVHSNSIPAM